MCSADENISVRRLAEMIESVEHRRLPVRRGGVLPTGWREVDAALAGALGGGEAQGGLRRGAIHEWFGGPSDGESGPAGRGGWPMCVLAHLAWQAVDADGAGARWVVWVSAGQGNWVNPQLLVRRQGADRRLMQRSLMVRADDQGQRLWAIDLALRCGAVTAVVADATGLKMPATRRLQLAAAGGDGIALLGRCRRELNVPSAAATRWSVSRRPSQHGPGWVVELLRCKGSQPANAAAGDSPAMAGHPHQPRWMLEWDGAAGAVIIPADVVERPGSQGQKLPAQQRRASRIA